MFISDLYHFLDLPEGTPGPAHRMAEHLCDIVRAATAGDAGGRLGERVGLPTSPGQPSLPRSIDRAGN